MTRPIEIAAAKDHFTAAGRPWFYLADTAWSAFTNARLDEWEEYLDCRRLQGFNALQINILRQWDRSRPKGGIHPFARRPDGTYDFTEINHDYFRRAADMLELARARGFTPALVVLWCNYVKGTWANAKHTPGDLMPFDCVAPYAEYVADTFGRFDPIFIVSGDTDFSEESTAYYRTALETLKHKVPGALATLHISFVDWPQEFVESPALDFYMYQSGHARDSDNPYAFAEKFAGLNVKRPVVNGEPCYEGIGYWKGNGRFGPAEVRKAIWQSLLSGAGAGVAYGAHGIWNWHRTGMKLHNDTPSKAPFEWKAALRFPGAWDAAFAKWIFETYSLFGVRPLQEALVDKTREIRVAASPDMRTIALYLPYCADVTLNLDLSGYDWTHISLADRRVGAPVVKAGKEGTVFKMHPCESDALIIGRR